jgi:glycosyltransferase involved in cell wall biosynthesis
VLFQSRDDWVRGQHELLSPAQRALPRVYLEHDPPREHPTDTRHPVDDPDVLLVHVTHFNALVWDAGRTPVRVIEHGVTVPDGVRYTGELPRGLAAVNNLVGRGRRLGADVFARARAEVPLDLVGIASEAAGGLGDVPHDRLPAFQVRYRFFFNPIRYTSLGLAVCEAMMLGMPVVGLATTEMATAIENGRSGWVDTDVAVLIDRMRVLLDDPVEARRLGDGARRRAMERFHIARFVRDWEDAFTLVTRTRRARTPLGVDEAAVSAGS